MEVDEATKALLSQQFVSLSSTVLDAADVASQAAKAANEAGGYYDYVDAMNKAVPEGEESCSWLVCDHRFQRRYGLGFARPAPVPPERIISPVGAGDAVCAGVIFGLHEGWPVAQALDLGHRAAATSLSTATATGVRCAACGHICLGDACV